jgi:hypothetical protein
LDSWELNDTSIIGGGTIGAPDGTYALLATDGNRSPDALVHAMASFNAPAGAASSPRPIMSPTNLTPTLVAQA